MGKRHETSCINKKIKNKFIYKKKSEIAQEDNFQNKCELVWEVKNGDLYFFSDEIDFFLGGGQGS